MSNTTRLHHQVEKWAEKHPRLKYSIEVGLFSGAIMLILSLFIKEVALVDAVLMGVLMFVGYYVVDPR